MFEIIQRQHAEILQLAQKISMYDSIPKVRENAFDISLLLGSLSGKLTMHLASEDKFIYPCLMKKQDPKIQETSKQFASEMGSLAQVFNDFKNKYLGDVKIKNAPGEFLEESGRVIEAIGERIAREEKHLYPLLDENHGPLSS